MSAHRCVLLAAILLGVLGGAPAQARADDQPEWEQLALDRPVLQLFTPSSGALLARSASELFRSDDAGDTWRTVGLPAPHVGLITVDPTNHDVLYAEADTTLFTSRDGGLNWQALGLKFDNWPGPHHLRGLEISPADPSLMYASVAYDYGQPRFLRSTDRGVTWIQLEGPNPNGPGSTCLYHLHLLRAHPTDPLRVFRSDGCGQGYGIAYGHAFSESTDRAANWAPNYQRALVAVTGMVGGEGTNPERWYISTTTLCCNPTDGAALRSDDDSASWETITAGLPIRGLAYNPLQPDTVYVGLASPEAGVLSSVDGGATWTPLGQNNIGSVQDLKLGVDGRNLYAATESGVWRLATGQ